MQRTSEERASKESPEGGAVVSPALKSVLIDLDRWLSSRPHLQPLGRHVECILRSAFSIPGSPVPSLDPAREECRVLIERIKEGWKAGAPAIAAVRPEIDRIRLIQRMRALAACTEHGQSPGRFHDVLRSNPTPIADWVLNRLSEGSEELPPELADAGVPAEYARAILRMTLLGELGDWSGRICDHLEESSWRSFGCPVCGEPPALGESRGLEQRRYLRCSCCGAGWPGHRLQCAFCGEVNPHRLRSLFAEEDQHRCRLVLCDGCGGRLKVITTLSPLSPPGLVFAEFTVLYLDELEPDEFEARTDGA
jgi:hypothetical protein